MSKPNLKKVLMQSYKEAEYLLILFANVLIFIPEISRYFYNNKKSNQILFDYLNSFTRNIKL